MVNDENLAQSINQEVIVEEINEEELEAVVGGIGILGLLGRGLGTFLVRATDALDELLTGIGSIQ
ncbi:MAG: bacteriocin [Nostoc sp. ChiSLP02]|nr:bacteriocin [Nostoc sp. DedSLP05]MDZ8098353.1 bacteriocin [Nostoc sp. DedSLP01]MDZ8188627.1 bacteriocin [Nostoc sp. ChiSLP02]